MPQRGRESNTEDCSYRRMRIQKPKGNIPVRLQQWKNVLNVLTLFLSHTITFTFQFHVLFARKLGYLKHQCSTLSDFEFDTYQYYNEHMLLVGI